MITFLRPWFLLFLLSLPAAWLAARDIRKRRGNLILRMATLLFLSLAIAGPRITAPSDAVSAMFVLDVSDSMGQGTDGGLAAVNSLAAEMDREDMAGLVTVASRAGTDVPLRPGGAPLVPELMHDGGRSRLADGIYTAAGAFRDDGSERRIVLVSDGRDDGGDLQAALEFARRSGAVVDILPAGADSGNEVLVESLSVSAEVAEGRVHALTAVIRAEVPTAARILIIRDGEYIGEDRKGLSAGVQRRSWELPAAEAGTHVYEVVVDPASDGNRDNNRGIAVSTVTGRPRVLWVGEGASAVPGALEVQGHAVDRRLPGGLPDTIAGYAGYEAVILDNVSARTMSLRSMDLLESWVRNRGGGLMMVGGDESFGPGGWQDTTIEGALPVSMDAPSSLYIPSLTMVMVVDKSGSMGSPASPGFTKLDLVKEAVLSAADVLNPLFSVGLLAFDADWEWTVPVTEAGNSYEIRNGLAGLAVGGGTELYPAIREAYETLVASPSSSRHLVVLSDGLTEQADFEALADAIARDGITLSTVAVGDDSARKLMESMAERGNGRYWYAPDATQVPRIFASESMIVSRGLTVEETVFPVPAMAAEAMEGIDLSLVPPLHGYVMTYPDTAAVEALRSPRGHPILVYGRHGLGRTASFSSDLRGSWGRDWTGWDQLPRLLSQTVRWMAGGPGGEENRLTLERDGEGVRLALELQAGTGGGEASAEAGSGDAADTRPATASRKAVAPRAMVTFPDGLEQEVPLTRTAPGLFEGCFLPAGDGVYGVVVTDEAAGLVEEAWWSRAYAPELGRAGTDMAALAEAAMAGGGRLLDPDVLAAEGSGWWKVRNPSDRTLFNLTALLALASLLVFLADIALRESESWRKKKFEKQASGEDNMDALILKGRESERLKPGARRLTAAEASRLLARRRMERESREDS